MPLIYDFREIPFQDKEGEQPSYQPYIISSGTVSSRQICKEICEASTFTVPDLEGALLALSQKVANYLSDGYKVELEHFGYFSVTLKADRPIPDPTKVRTDMLCIDKVHFRPSVELRKGMSPKFKRARHGYKPRRSSQLSDDECRKRLLIYLEKHGSMTRPEYSALTGKLKNTALRQLRKFVAEGVVVVCKRDSQQIYRLPPQERDVSSQE